MESEITFQIILINPTPEVMYGLQKESGSTYETIQKQIAKANDLIFKFSVTVKGDESKVILPKFSGIFVQGPKTSHFVYIDIGTSAGQLNSIWSRRLKIPLTGISWEDIESLSSKDIFETSVPGSSKDGSPNCATVKPFLGWKIKAI